MDADLVLVGLGAEQVSGAGDLFQKHRHGPCIGRRLKGRVAGALVRGNLVFDDGKTASETT